MVVLIGLCLGVNILMLFAPCVCFHIGKIAAHSAYDMFHHGVFFPTSVFGVGISF